VSTIGKTNSIEIPLWLVVSTCFNPSEKYESVGIIIPNYMEKQKMFQTTNQILLKGKTS
jgi:hypothetical protein